MPRTTWGRRYPHCVNCETTWHQFRGRGFCIRCWPYSDLIRRIDAGEFATGNVGPNGWSTGDRWRAELRTSCEVHLRVIRDQEQRVRGELEVTGWHLHVELESFRRMFRLSEPRADVMLHRHFPTEDARRTIYTWLIDWEAGHRWNQRIEDLMQRAHERIRFEYFQNGSRQVE